MTKVNEADTVVHPSVMMKLEWMTICLTCQSSRSRSTNVGEEQGARDLSSKALEIEIVPRWRHTATKDVNSG